MWSAFLLFQKNIFRQKLFCLLLLPCFLMGQDGNMQIRFEHKVGNQILQLDKNYTNSFNETYTVSRFRYYISQIRLTDTISGNTHLIDDHFLIKEEDDDSKAINFNLPPGKYNKLELLLGVDSIRNVSGAQSGALDPLHGMFWTWKTGYIMAMLEGRSDASALQRRMFEYHIGGFSGENSVIRTLSLPLTLSISPGKTTAIFLVADLNKWFKSKHNLSISNHPACTTTGLLAKQFSENYLAMFTLQTTRNK